MEPWRLFVMIPTFAIATLLFWHSLARNREHKGSDITLHYVERDQKVKIVTSSSVTIEAAGNSSFVLRNPEDDEIIIGKKASVVPVGWTDEEHYKSEPFAIKSSVWTVMAGHPTIHLLENGLDNMSATRCYDFSYKLLALVASAVLISILMILGILVRDLLLDVLFRS